MSDSASTGNRLDQAIEAAKQAASELRDKLGTAASGVADDVASAVDAVSAKIDEIQAAWAARREGDQAAQQSQSQPPKP